MKSMEIPIVRKAIEDWITEHWQIKDGFTIKEISLIPQGLLISFKPPVPLPRQPDLSFTIAPELDVTDLSKVAQLNTDAFKTISKAQTI